MNLKQLFTFVEFSHGEFEGALYNNIAISNGIRTLSFKNKTNQDDLLASLKEGDSIVAELELKFGKKNLTGNIVHIEKAEEVKKSK